MVRIARVQPEGIAAELGITPGSELRSVNGRELKDFLDWEFLSADETIELEVGQPDGEVVTYEVENPDLEPWGITLEPPTVRRCANRCEFCFIEGLPQGLRKPLYIRDDDYRLSPLYVSVHATNWEARKVLLNNQRVPNILGQLGTLADGGIQFHTQMVVVPGLNDEAILEESLSDLWNFGDAVLSAAVVPVGLTQFSHLYTGKTMDAENSGRILDQVERWSAKGLAERGDQWVRGSDELYLLAGRPLPSAEYYGEFAQIENGVGAVTRLRMNVRAGLDRLPKLIGRRIGIVTGTSMAPLMPELLDQLSATTGAHFELIVAENSLFGPTTTTAGLLVGADITRALQGRHDLDLALIPAETINDDGLFLDDTSFVAVREALPMPVYPSYDFIDVLEQETHAVAA